MAAQDSKSMHVWRTAGRHRARLLATDRLQPALLDRLMDDEPGKPSERQPVMMSNVELRRAVLRDLRWLLNTVNLETTDEISTFPWVESSTLNYGVRAMAGKRMSEIDWVDVEEAIHRAIIRFEPRILPDTLEVRCMSDVLALEHYNILSLSIRGMLWCEPQPLEFVFRSDVDLECGHTNLREVEGE